MGNPVHISVLPASEYIACWRQTRGTETSQYPQEEKENSIPIVAASEVEEPKPRSLLLGVVGLDIGVTKVRRSRSQLESCAIEGESPVNETADPPSRILSTAEHVNSVGIREDHLPRLNTP